MKSFIAFIIRTLWVAAHLIVTLAGRLLLFCFIIAGGISLLDILIGMTPMIGDLLTKGGGFELIMIWVAAEAVLWLLLEGYKRFFGDVDELAGYISFMQTVNVLQSPWSILRKQMAQEMTYYDNERFR